VIWDCSKDKEKRFDQRGRTQERATGRERLDSGLIYLHILLLLLLCSCSSQVAAFKSSDKMKIGGLNLGSGWPRKSDRALFFFFRNGVSPASASIDAHSRFIGNIQAFTSNKHRKSEKQLALA
jgi:hypothetical protein